MPEILVTHYSPELPQAGVWLPLDIVTRHSDEPNRFHFGFDERRHFTAAEIDARTKVGAIREVRGNLTIQASEGLWLTPEGEIWRAKRGDPVNDPRRAKVLV